MASLIDDLATPPTKASSKTIIERWMSTLEVDQQEAVRAAMIDPAWRHVDLKRILIEHGMPAVSEHSLVSTRTKLGWHRP